jgi:hypothetical protein
MPLTLPTKCLSPTPPASCLSHYRQSVCHLLPLMHLTLPTKCLSHSSCLSHYPESEEKRSGWNWSAPQFPRLNGCFRAVVRKLSRIEFALNDFGCKSFKRWRFRLLGFGHSSRMRVIGLALGSVETWRFLEWISCRELWIQIFFHFWSWVGILLFPL